MFGEAAATANFLVAYRNPAPRLQNGAIHFYDVVFNEVCDIAYTYAAGRIARADLRTHILALH